MYRITAERLTVNKTARIGCVSWVILNDFAMKNREEDFIKGELISFRFFISMITNTDTIVSYTLNDVGNVDVRCPPSDAV